MGDSDTERLLEAIKHYQKSLERYAPAGNTEKMLHALSRLARLPIKMIHLEQTGVGRTVNQLKKIGGEAGDAARSLVDHWKEMVKTEEHESEDEPMESEANKNAASPLYGESHSNTDDSDHLQISSPKNSENEHNRKKRSLSPENNRKNVKKRKHSEHSDSEKSSDDISSDESSKKTKNTKERLRRSSESDENSSSDDGSEESEDDSDYSSSSEHNSRSGKESTKSRNKSDKKSSSHSKYKKERDSSQSSDDEKDRKNSSRNKEKEKDRHRSDKDKKSHSYKEEKKGKSKLSSSLKTEDKKHSKSEDKNKKVDRSSSEDKDKKHTSHSSSDDKYKKSSRSDGSSSKKNRDESSSKSKHREESSSRKSEKDSDRGKDKKSEKDKNSEKDKKHESSRDSKDKTKSKESSTSDKDRHKDRKSSNKDKDRQKDKERSSSKRHDDKEKIKVKEDSDKEKRKEKHSSSSKDKESSSKESSKDKEKSKSSKTNSPSPSKSKKISITNGEINSDSGASFAEALGMLGPPRKIKKKLPQTITTEIDSESGASFADALGMCVPHSSSKPTPKKNKIGGESSSGSSSSMTKDSSDKNVPKLLKEAKLEPLDINVDVLLPPPNYRPLGAPVEHGNKIVLNGEDMLNRVISNKNQRTKVYSGNKNYTKVPSLFDICCRVLQDNIDALEFTGGVPYSVLKPILEKANPNQLYMLEHYNPYFIEDTDELWKLHCQKDFKTKKREELESWREMYMRCLDEREMKLKALTANIKQSQDKSVPVRTTKMAFVDDFVKPPRNVLRKQVKNGTARGDRVPLPIKKKELATTGEAGKISVPNPVHRNTERSSSSSHQKPKKAPLMAKLLSSMKGSKFPFGRR